MSLKKIILSADSSCDLGPHLKSKYNVNYSRFHILLDNRSYLDGMDLSSNDIFTVYRQTKSLPKTSAIGVGEYYEYFKQWTDKGFEVIHINISSSISSTYQNCCIAANELEGVYPIDSKNLTTGMGLLVIEAAKRIEKGLPAKEIQAEITNLTQNLQTSFVLDTLEFLCAGGRCSTLSAMGANILKLKPCIEVNNATGTMSLGKKYRGSLDKVLIQYTNEKLANVDKINKERIFITHTMQSPELIELVYNHIKNLNIFDEIHITDASCTVSSHCGPNTLGLIFLNN